MKPNEKKDCVNLLVNNDDALDQDEATSALDTEAEAKVQRALDEMIKEVPTDKGPREVKKGKGGLLLWTKNAMTTVTIEKKRSC